MHVQGGEAAYFGLWGKAQTFSWGVIIVLHVQASGKLFKRLNPEGSQEPVVWVLMPALGGLCTGAVGLAFPEILYQGFGNVNAMLELKSEVYAPLLLLQMLAAKIFTTAICRGSGLVGGIYAPSIFMGEMLDAVLIGLCLLILAVKDCDHGHAKQLPNR